MPGSVHSKLAGVNAVADSDNQKSGESDAYAQRVKGAFWAGFIAILEQKYQAAKQARQNAKQQKPYYNFDGHAG